MTVRREQKREKTENKKESKKEVKKDTKKDTPVIIRREVILNDDEETKKEEKENMKRIAEAESKAKVQKELEDLIVQEQKEILII